MSAIQADWVLRPMQVDDIPQVVEIDRMSFPLPWPARAYRYELTENHASHLIVAELDPPGTAGRPRAIIGYVGFWHVVDEAHISTIAVHPEHRGQGAGEQLLVAALLRAIELGATKATLEVRVSNAAAQALYHKYGFEIASQRLNYYRDNGEDALIMNAERLSDPTFRDRLLQVIRNR